MFDSKSMEPDPIDPFSVDLERVKKMKGAWAADLEAFERAVKEDDHLEQLRTKLEWTMNAFRDTSQEAEDLWEELKARRAEMAHYESAMMFKIVAKLNKRARYMANYKEHEVYVNRRHRQLFDKQVAAGLEETRRKLKMPRAVGTKDSQPRGKRRRANQQTKKDTDDNDNQDTEEERETGHETASD